MSFITDIQGAKFGLSIVPQSINGTDTNGTGVDTLGFHYAMFVFHLGATTADFDASGLNLLECETSGGTYTAVSGSAFTVPTSTDDNGFWVCYVDLRNNRKRFLAWHANPGAAATLMTGFGILFRGDSAPDTATLRGVTQALVI